MVRLWHSVAFRLASTAGILLVLAVVLLSSVFYVGTIGVLSRGADNKIRSISSHLNQDFETRGLAALVLKIQSALTDGVDSDTEIYLLTTPTGAKLAGNIAAWADATVPLDRVIEHDVTRDHRISSAHLLLHRLPDGSLLIVGRDMQDLVDIERLISRALAIGGAAALVLAIGGTLLLRRLIERRISTIRHTAHAIEAGNLHQRIPVSEGGDEFTRLSNELNHMLDRIQQLMDGVRHVSNVIAHNLRTPLGRIRGHLEKALRTPADSVMLAREANYVIDEVDGLIVVLEKLLQIAEAESGTRRQPFEPVDLRELVTDVVELYDAAAEALGIRLISSVEEASHILGDRDLIACALGNLLDNAFKYAGENALVLIHIFQRRDGVALIVQDNGPGIPLEERTRVLQRFYRLDGARPGHGLGLSIVAAIAQAHGATLHLDDAKPGLQVRLLFPLVTSGSVTLVAGNSVSGRSACNAVHSAPC
ncbi:HAMP domain-containing sensor histidine kinase [Azoarcus sp. DN11]|uniref:sensor histidine kinase n=1 Tax=Azoarcus sp. DN11 TaxID=356837 RepID=UPI000EB5D52D|nr:HAMP domain-containing sensor histidine kinase [Azoarcus sp. DN11]AYH43984.1 hypothetical protein CDA09_11400 [Azoarcus sp. DN11]